jgi:hypothetical protein
MCLLFFIILPTENFRIKKARGENMVKNTKKAIKNR